MPRETPSLGDRLRSCGCQILMMGIFLWMLVGTGAFWVFVAGGDIPALGIDGGGGGGSHGDAPRSRGKRR